jgi:putative membrane-bound dehydrogenase-like protein
MTRLIAHLLGALLLAAVRLPAAERPHDAKAVQPGVTLTLVSEHPNLVTPTGIDVDQQGNIWVVASHTHFPPKDYQGPKLDEILVFSKQGKRSVFYNQTHHTMDLELGENGWVYLAERDRILRIRDTDGDGRADQEQNIAVLDSKAEYPHNGLSGLAWHPNGNLYFTLGENFNQAWVLTGLDGRTATGTGEGGVFHCHPDGRQLTRIARGMWNPFGLTVRADGEIFAAENDPGERPPCRILHIVEGGDYGFQRDYGPGAHHPFVCWNGELRGSLPMLHPSGEAPCGILPLGRGLLVPSWGDHRIDFFPLTQQGASYTARRIELVNGTRYFRPTCITYAEHQSNADRKTWYLTDWVDGSYNVHGFGRIWKLEIDLRKAGWLGPLDLPKPTEEAEFARQFRSGKNRFALSALLAYARNEDPFVANAALVRLSRRTSELKPDKVGRWFPVDRVSVIGALRIAQADPEPWVRLALNDQSPDVQFETLHWITDGSLQDGQFKRYLPDVERLLKRNNLSFELFEAGIAAWNTLSGKPEVGLNNTEMLLARVKDAASPPQLRAFALRLLPTMQRSAAAKGPFATLRFPKGVTVELLAGLLKIDNDDLSLETVRVLSGHPAAGKHVLARVAKDKKKTTELRAEAIAGLAAVANEYVADLVNLTKSPDQTVAEEALRSLRNQTLTAAQTAVIKQSARTDLTGAILSPASLGQDRPDLTDIAGWQQRLASLPGKPDLNSGRRIFHHASVALCARCHRHSGRGKIVGPDLTFTGRQKDREWFLKAILQPSADMAPEYQPRELTLTDGSSHTGIRLRSYSREQLRDINGNTITFHKDKVAGIRDLNSSLMPEGLVYSLTDRELRDLLAFLEQ